MTRKKDVTRRVRQVTAAALSGADISVERDFTGYEITARTDDGETLIISTDGESTLGEVMGITRENNT